MGQNIVGSSALHFKNFWTAHFFAKCYLILYPRDWNFTTGIAIAYLLTTYYHQIFFTIQTQLNFNFKFRLSRHFPTGSKTFQKFLKVNKQINKT